MKALAVFGLLLLLMGALVCFPIWLIIWFFKNMPSQALAYLFTAVICAADFIVARYVFKMFKVTGSKP
jgi:hypothetical protein